MPTIRQAIIELLKDEELNGIDISQALSVQEKEVYEHLTHIKRTLRKQGIRLQVTPYHCLGCGYSFKDRDRFDRPGRCPVCKGSHIRMATFHMAK